MKRWLLILILLPCIAFGQQTYVPDDNFEQELINLGYDTGPLDDFVPTANISSVTNLFIGSLNISDLTGIEDFASLSDLSCWGNQLTTLDVSQNTNLIQLDCSGNPLTSLNVTGLTALLYLYTDFCQLTSLDVSTNISLDELDFEVNQISSIDLSNNTALVSLYCTLNQLTSLDLSLNTALEFLMCRDNLLTCLNMRNIDQQNMTGFIAYNNPCLYCIDVDDPIWATANWTPSGLNIDTIASFSTNCPGNCTSSGNGYPLTMNICQGDSLLAGGSYQTNTGTYYDTLLTINNCDSIIVTALTILPVTTNAISYDICQGDSLLAGGSYQTNTGIYYDTLLTINSCDSIIITILTVLPVITNPVSYDICQGDSLLAGGSYQTNTGTYYDTLLTINSCDSIIITALTALPVTTNPVSYTICQGDSLLAGGSYQTNIGTYYDTLVASNSCDSILITSLNILSSITNAVSYDICQGDSLLAGGSYQTNTGTYYDTLVASNSCDSIIISELTIYDKPVIQLSSDTSIVLGANLDLFASGASTYLWSTGDTGTSINVAPTQTTTYSVTGSNVQGCSSGSVMTVTVSIAFNFYIPNIFSPTGNQPDNKRLCVYGANIEALALVIYDRWGNMVFQTTDASESIRQDGHCCKYGEGWDGTNNNNGQELNSGVFAYKLRVSFINGEEVFETGNITLSR